MNDTVNAFATTNKGLEPILIDELTQHGLTDIKPATAGVKFKANYNKLIELNLTSRYSSRILMELVTSKYSKEEDIYDLCYQINWSNYFKVNSAIKVKTRAINCPLKSLNFITLKVKDAVCDKFVKTDGLRPDVNKINPDILIYTFLTKDSVTIYLDTSGEGLFKRGYRQDKLEAPLKENLASGLVKYSNWDFNSSLMDPMCGSGTIIIEALSQALNIAPGLNRNFAFEKLKCFNLDEFKQIKINIIKQINLNKNIKLYANDISIKAVTIAKDNLNLFINNLKQILPNKQKEIDAISNNIHFSMKNFLDLTAPTPTGVLVSNLPYGVRMEEQEALNNLYPKLATWLKNNYTNWTTYLLSHDLQIPKLMRLKPSRKTPIFNGPLECRLFEFKIVSGSNRNK